MSRIHSASVLSLRSAGLLTAVCLGLLATAASCSGDDPQGDDTVGTGGFGGFGGFGGGGQPPGSGGAMQPPPYTGTCPSAIFQPCKVCHDGEGTAATPMGLAFWEDFHAPSKTNSSLKVYQVLPSRLRATTPSPMPPEGMLDAGKLAAIDAWVQAGAPDCGGFARKAPPVGTGGVPNIGAGGGPVGTGGVPVGGAGGVPVGTGGMPVGGNGGSVGFDVTPYLSPDGQYFIKDPPGDKPVGPDAKNADYCFNITAHNAQTPLPQDPTKFNVRTGEYYHAFQFKVPYDRPVWTLSTRPIIDNKQVIHHWLLFQMGGAGRDGSHADEIGLQLNNALLTGWAPGGNPLDMPPGVGLEMPAPGAYMLLENHYFNTTGGAKEDRSGVRVCVTYTKPQNPASLTWLGTEAINIPAGGQGTATGSCTSWKKNADVHVFQTVPHMHQIGKHMKTVINRAGGGQTILVDKPFAFADQRAYPIDVVIKPGDTMTTTCTFQNTGARSVGFGTSSTSEMCYNFVVYYPAHALDGIGGIEGSTNMCLF